MKLKIKSLLEYSKHYFVVAFSNKLRAFLTIIGISVIVCILTLIIYTSTKNINSILVANNFSENMVLVSKCDRDEYESFKILEEDINAYYFGDYKLVKADSVNFSCIACENDGSLNFVDANKSVFKKDFIYGRDFNELDYQGLNKSVIVTESAYTYLRSLDGFDNTINLSTTTYEDNYEIVGVIKDNYASLSAYNRFINRKSMSISIDVFYPKTKINNISQCLFVGNDSLLGFSKKIQNDNTYLEVYDYSNTYSDIKLGISSVVAQNFGFIIGLVACSVVALCVFMLFSQKERVSEVGVRKALGATKYMIVEQYVYEYLIYGIIGGVFGTILGVLLYLLFEFISVSNTLFYVFSFSIIPALLVFFVSLLIIILVSTITSIIAANMKVVDALRFE